MLVRVSIFGEYSILDVPDFVLIFAPRINGRPIFCVGTNWIPCKSMPTEVTPELYRQWIDLAVENNNNMIRIWGGGYYENNEFYEYCDEKGIMLWYVVPCVELA